MRERLANVQAPTDRAVPTRIGTFVFETKAALLRLKRAGSNLSSGAPKRHRRGETLTGAPVLATIRSPLWTATGGGKDRALNAGKIQNLRAAIGGLDGIEVNTGDVLSFWRQVGKPLRRRGFVKGRELREGCMIATVGGGLCQLSNALHEAALDAGLETVERHAHTRIVPGSRAAAGSDATVFWNYLDFRVRSPHPFRVEARLTADELELTIRGETAVRPFTTPDLPADKIAHDCLSCGQISCHRHDPDTARVTAPTAWLVDTPSPEFTALYREAVREDDLLMLPSRRLGRHAAAWPVIATERTADLAVIRRSLALRTAPAGKPRAALLLASDARLAMAYARKLPATHTHLVVTQSLLPHLWRLGELQGRSFDVLLDRLPMEPLQALLDAAADRHADSPTLGDFRAPSVIVAAESDALGAARRLITPHQAIAESLPAGRIELIGWEPVPPLDVKRGGRTFLFAGPAVARKGIHAMREAMTGLNIALLVERSAVDCADFWRDLNVRLLQPTERPRELAGVILPALIEHNPRTLLRALAAGLPAIATPACGLPAQQGLAIVPPDDPIPLRAAILAALSPQGGSLRATS